jgi:DNA-directed RNA polymerase subunit N (RpoN/RPB10)
MIRVVRCEDGKTSQQVFDLLHSTVEKLCGTRMFFCYYQEVNDTTVYSGMTSEDQNIKVFIKLVDDEPVDLTIEDWQKQWSRFPEFIPVEKICPDNIKHDE